MTPSDLHDRIQAATNRSQRVAGGTPPRGPEQDVDGERLREWLTRAGRRNADAVARFVRDCVLFGVLGLLVALVAARSQWLGPWVALGNELPESVSALVIPVLEISPFVLALMIGMIPWLRVRAERRARVAAIERDLPSCLELLATLAEAGLAFDAALERILDAESEPGALHQELRQFQLETRSGTSRVRALRRLAKRLAVPALSTFVSAVVQAEQLGLGIAGVLRTQALDQRTRRREHALLQAQSLPVKLVFPLILCFLPSIFVFTLGPAFYSFFRLTAGVIGSNR